MYNHELLVLVTTSSFHIWFDVCHAFGIEPLGFREITLPINCHFHLGICFNVNSETSNFSFSSTQSFTTLHLSYLFIFH